ncbi:MAG: 6-bladed beta-propeller [Pseudomonadota bacterium]
MRWSTHILLLGLVLLVSACAETPMAFRLGDPNHGAAKVWPDAPEQARYRYVGELTGENNFLPDDAYQPSAAQSVFNWLVGLVGSGKPKPVMLQRPQSGVTDENGRIYVTDIGRAAVYVFDIAEAKLEVWDQARAESRFESPIGIALGKQGEILVADAQLHTIFRLDSTGKPVGEFGGNDLLRPTGLARDPQNALIYVADTYAHNIKIFDDNGILLGTIGQRGEADGEFNFPTHLYFSGGKLYVTDTLNSRIQIFDSSGKMIGKFGKRGLNVGNLVRPKGVAVDSEDNIYVVESFYDNLLVFDQSGRTLLSLGGNGNEAGQFYLPAGVWADHRDQIYVADMFNGRVTIVQYLGTANERNE